MKTGSKKRKIIILIICLLVFVSVIFKTAGTFPYSGHMPFNNIKLCDIKNAECFDIGKAYTLTENETIKLCSILSRITVISKSEKPFQ